MHSSKSKTLFIAAVLLNVVAAAAYSFLWFGIKAANERFSRLGEEIELADKQKKELVLVRALVSDTAQLRAKLDSYFISNDGAVSFFESLEAQGNATGASVSIESISVLPVSDSSPFESIRIVARAEGSFAAVLRSLALFEMTPRAAWIEQVSFGVRDLEMKTRASLWRADVTIRVLKLKAPAAQQIL